MKKMLALAVLLAAAPLAASAAEISHNYVEGGYVRADMDTADLIGEDVSFDGAYIRGSVGFSENFYAIGEYSRARNNDYGTSIDLDRTALGLGYAMPIGERAEFNAELSYLRLGVEVSDFDVNEHGDGARLGVGVRGLLSDNFEGWAKAQYADGGDFDGDFSGVLGAQVKFNQTWGLVGEVEVAEDINTYSLGLRASF